MGEPITDSMNMFGSVSLQFVKGESFEPASYFSEQVDSDGTPVYLHIATRYDLGTGNQGLLENFIHVDLLDRFMDESHIEHRHISDVPYDRLECVLCMSGDEREMYVHTGNIKSPMHLSCYRELCDSIEEFSDLRRDELLVEVI